MPIAIKMPALSPTMEEGTLAKWLVKVGDKVSSGDIMAEIETDKATMEFEAVDEGTIVSIDVAEGSEGVKVGTVIATLAGEDEDASAPAPKAVAPAAAPVPVPAPKAEPAPAAVSTPAPAAASASKGDRVIATPLAKRIAADKGIDLKGVAGSGPNGRIIRADVEGAKPAAAAPVSTVAPAVASAAAPARAPAAVPDFGIPYEAQKLNNVRKTIARRLTEAKQTIPHFYLRVSASVDALMDLRKTANLVLGTKASINDYLVKAVALALVRHPDVNVQVHGDSVHSFPHADVAIAVASPKGLVTPIVRQADRMHIAQIAATTRALIDKAQAGRLGYEDMDGGTFSVSNLGMFGIEQFDAIINPPQGAILAVGGVNRVAVEAANGDIAFESRIQLTMSVDHRAIDGAAGAQFLQTLKGLLEAPEGLFA